MDCTFQTMSRWNGTVRISADIDSTGPPGAVQWPLSGSAAAVRVTGFPPNPFSHDDGAYKTAHYGYSCLTELPVAAAVGGRSPTAGRSPLPVTGSVGALSNSDGTV